jgi:hypothetical protein
MANDGHSESDFSGSDADPAPVPDRAPTSIGALISQLKKEPRSDEEKASKFMLYEAYSMEVQSMRATLLEAHQDCRPFLNYAAAADIKQEITRIDSREAMSIPNESEWFVYHMMRVAERNNNNMARIFESIERAVNFEGASEGSECPMCLERFDGTRLLTLGCCHKVCHDCWKHWIDVMHALAKHPFCPTCSATDFMGVVQSEVRNGRQPRVHRSEGNGISPHAPSNGHALSRWATECWGEACAHGPAAASRRDGPLCPTRQDGKTCFGTPLQPGTPAERKPQDLGPSVVSSGRSRSEKKEKKDKKEAKHKQVI